MQLNEQITQAIWELLRGKHIDLDHRHFSIIKENEEVFIQHVNALGYQFLSSDLGFYYLQRDGKKEETQKPQADFVVYSLSRCKGSMK